MRAGRFVTAWGSGLLLTLLAVAAARAVTPAQWRPLVRAEGVVDVVGPRADGRLAVSTRGGLILLRRDGTSEPFARGAGGYVPTVGGEQYAAVAPARRLRAQRCSFHRDDVFVLDASAKPGVVRVLTNGRATRLADLPAGTFPSGIAFDTVGRFGYRLLVTGTAKSATTLYAVDCAGGVTEVSKGAPVVEGGIVVAPRSFGGFGGDLIAADERSGKIFAFGAGGPTRLVAQSGIRAGGDIGVESLGFVPRGFDASGTAYLADLGAPGSPTEGTNSVLVLRGRDLAQARLRPGELVAATEAGATTIAIDCARRCKIRRVAVGPAATHGEGHVTFAP